MIISLLLAKKHLPAKSISGKLMKQELRKIHLAVSSIPELSISVTQFQEEEDDFTF